MPPQEIALAQLDILSRRLIQSYQTRHAEQSIAGLRQRLVNANHIANSLRNQEPNPNARIPLTQRSLNLRYTLAMANIRVITELLAARELEQLQQQLQ